MDSFFFLLSLSLEFRGFFDVVMNGWDVCDEGNKHETSPPFLKELSVFMLFVVVFHFFASIFDKLFLIFSDTSFYFS